MSRSSSTAQMGPCPGHAFVAADTRRACELTRALPVAIDNPGFLHCLPALLNFQTADEFQSDVLGEAPPIPAAAVTWSNGTMTVFEAR